MRTWPGSAASGCEGSGNGIFEGKHEDPNERESVTKTGFESCLPFGPACEDHQTTSLDDIEPNWFEFLFLFHQPIQAQAFYFWGFVRYPFPN